MTIHEKTLWEDPNITPWMPVSALAIRLTSATEPFLRRLSVRAYPPRKRQAAWCVWPERLHFPAVAGGCATSTVHERCGVALSDLCAEGMKGHRRAFRTEEGHGRPAASDLG